MSEEVTVFDWSVPEPTDDNLVPADMKALALDIGTTLNDVGIDETTAAGIAEGKLLVVGSTGALAFKAMSGDATLDKAGKLVIADDAILGKHIADDALLAQHYDDGSVGEPAMGDASVTSRKFKPSSGLYISNASPSITTVESEIGGVKFTLKPPVASYLDLVVAIKYHVTETHAELDLRSQLYKNGVAAAETYWAAGGPGDPSLGYNVSYPCRIAIAKDEEVEVALRLWKSVNVGKAISIAGLTRVSYLLRAQ